MVRASKSTDKSVATTTTQSAVVEASVSVAAVKQPRAKKAKAVVSVEPAVANTLTSSVVVDEVAEVSDASTLLGKMTEFGAKLQQLVSVFSTVKNDFKALEKAVAREVKNAQKASSKKRQSTGNRKPSGFIKPTRISDELAEFLGKTVGTEMARTEVSKEINAYIRVNALQDKTNGRKIIPDAKLAKLLKWNKEDELTYFNLQRFMKHHFLKMGELVATA